MVRRGGGLSFRPSFVERLSYLERGWGNYVLKGVVNLPLSRVGHLRLLRRPNRQSSGGTNSAVVRSLS